MRNKEMVRGKDRNGEKAREAQSVGVEGEVTGGAGETRKW